MIKLGGIICDMCRILLDKSCFKRKNKRGTLMHFCEKCKLKDIKQNEFSKNK